MVEVDSTTCSMNSMTTPNGYVELTPNEISIELVKAINTVFTTDPLGINVPGCDTLADVIKGLDVTHELGEIAYGLNTSIPDAINNLAKAICQAAGVVVPR